MVFEDVVVGELDSGRFSTILGNLGEVHGRSSHIPRAIIFLSVLSHTEIPKHPGQHFRGRKICLLYRIGHRCLYGIYKSGCGCRILPRDINLKDKGKKQDGQC